VESQVTLRCGAIVIALAGCGTDDLPCRLPAGSDVLECLELDVTSTVAFDHVDVFAATHSLASTGPIATPAIEAGATVPDTFLIYAHARPRSTRHPLRPSIGVAPRNSAADVPAQPRGDWPCDCFMPAHLLQRGAA
jgi:hypothetical protein